MSFAAFQDRYKEVKQKEPAPFDDGLNPSAAMEDGQVEDDKPPSAPHAQEVSDWSTTRPTKVQKTNHDPTSVEDPTSPRSNSGLQDDLTAKHATSNDTHGGGWLDEPDKAPEPELSKNGHVESRDEEPAPTNGWNNSLLRSDNGRDKKPKSVERPTSSGWGSPPKGKPTGGGWGSPPKGQPSGGGWGSTSAPTISSSSPWGSTSRETPKNKDESTASKTIPPPKQSTASSSSSWGSTSRETIKDKNDSTASKISSPPKQTPDKPESPPQNSSSSGWPDTSSKENEANTLKPIIGDGWGEKPSDESNKKVPETATPKTPPKSSGGWGEVSTSSSNTGNGWGDTPASSGNNGNGWGDAPQTTTEERGDREKRNDQTPSSSHQRPPPTASSRRKRSPSKNRNSGWNSGSKPKHGRQSSSGWGDLPKESSNGSSIVGGGWGSLPKENSNSTGSSIVGGGWGSNDGKSANNSSGGGWGSNDNKSDSRREDRRSSPPRRNGTSHCGGNNGGSRYGDNGGGSNYGGGKDSHYGGNSRDGGGDSHYGGSGPRFDRGSSNYGPRRDRSLSPSDRRSNNRRSPSRMSENRRRGQSQARPDWSRDPREPDSPPRASGDWRRGLREPDSPPPFFDGGGASPPPPPFRGRSHARSPPRDYDYMNRGRSMPRGPSIARSHSIHRSKSVMRGSVARAKSTSRPGVPQWNMPYDGPPPGYFDDVDHAAGSMLNGIYDEIGHKRVPYDIGRPSVGRPSVGRDSRRSRSRYSVAPRRIRPAADPNEWLFSIRKGTMNVQCRGTPMALSFNRQPLPEEIRITQLPKLREFNAFMHLDDKLQCPHWIYELEPMTPADRRAYEGFQTYLLRGRSEACAGMSTDVKGYKVIIMPSGQEARHLGYAGTSLIAAVRKNKR
ncbi:hypothetical protein AeMF1_021845 [Aphanomyces euteiches]|nr:hypothetical protein AeMF1_021845 [Aphanomyces euteiches]KAH9192106.1 hypothetical protein AeNC1_005922 [Aphanomyces euteiches]